MTLSDPSGMFIPSGEIAIDQIILQLNEKQQQEESSRRLWEPLFGEFEFLKEVELGHGLMRFVLGNIVRDKQGEGKGLVFVLVTEGVVWSDWTSPCRLGEAHGRLVWSDWYVRWMGYG